MHGKYSPTVIQAYAQDENWFTKYSGRSKDGSIWPQWDKSGFNSYGYDEGGYDRAGNHENSYTKDQTGKVIEGYNALYEQVLDSWSFDGTKPVMNGHD